MNAPRLGLLALLVAAPLFWSIGIHYGLPTANRTLSVDNDEFTWIEGLSRMKPRRLDLDPKSPHQPHAYMYMYGAALGAAAAAGYIDLRHEKTYFFDHVAEWRKFYLVGRRLQAVFGVLCLLGVYGLGAELEGEMLGLLAAALFAVLPGTFGVAHFSQANLPVTLWTILALLSCVHFAKGGGEVWGAAAAAATGLAISTKYSALPLAGVLAWVHASRAGSWRGALGGSAMAGYVLMAAAFFAGTPAALVHPASFWGRFFGGFMRDNIGHYENAGLLSRDPLWFRPILPLAWPLTDAMGAALVLVSLAGTVHVLRERRPGFWVAVAWLGLLYPFLIKVGRLATPGRCLVAAPAMILCAGSLLLAHWRKSWAKAALALVFINAFAVDYALARHYASNELVQEASAAWLDRWLPAGAEVAVPRDPYLWSPDNVVRSVTHPETLARPIRLRVLNYDYDALLKARSPYVLAVYNEIENNPYPTYPLSSDFDRRLKEHGDYRLLKAFPFDLSLGAWTIYRVRPFMNWDYVYTQPLYLYVRADLYPAESERLKGAL